MQRACHPRAIACILSGRPNIGALMELCEENFARLVRIAPDLGARSGIYTSIGVDGVELHLDVQEQARFTTTCRLTYLFPAQGAQSRRADPDALLRIYHDSRQVEVLDLRQTILTVRTDYQPPALAVKWQANVFLAKWLAYCLRQGHVFGTAPVIPRSMMSGACDARSLAGASCALPTGSGMP
jgi:uncharacterized protein YqiB (DUF1249 family)